VRPADSSPARTRQFQCRAFSPCHANVSQTSTYLNATTIGLLDSMRRFDGRIRTSFAQEDDAQPAATPSPAPTMDGNALVN
jgi:hypothetical protein